MDKYEITELCKPIPANTLQTIANVCSPGIDWRGSSKTSILDSIFGKEYYKHLAETGEVLETSSYCSSRIKVHKFIVIVTKVRETILEHREAMKRDVDDIIWERN